MNKLINLTGHEVHDLETGTIIPESDKITRVVTKRVKVGEVNGISIYDVGIENITDLPERQEGVTYIVSPLVLKHTSHRDDLVATGPTKRKKDKVVGCYGFRVGD